MNKQRRKSLSEAETLLLSALDSLERAMDIIDEVRDEEEEAYDNLPEQFQDGERGEEMQEYIDTLEEIFSEFESCRDTLQDYGDSLNEIIG